MEENNWLGKYKILHPDDINDLDSRAAVHEFKSGMPREKAEAQAHKDYIRHAAIDAAAHHLLGIKAAHACGNDDAASRHGEAYAGAMSTAGLNAWEPPPVEVMDRVKASKPNIYSFKAHKADQMWAPQPVEPDDGDAHIRELLEKIKQIKKSLV